MPVLLSEDDFTQTVQTDDGRTVVVAKPYSDPLGLGAAPLAGQEPNPADQPLDPFAATPMSADQAPSILPAAPSPGTEALPTEAPGQPAPETIAPPEFAPQAPPPTPESAPVAAPPPAADVLPRTAVEAAQQGIVGLQQESQARADVAQTESAGLEQQAQVQAQADQRIQQQELLRQQYADFRAKEEQFLTQEKSALVDRYANFKIDRNRRFKDIGAARTTWAWIATALAELGTALQGKTPGNAVQMLLGELDKDVQLQMADRDAIGTAIGMKSQEIADFRQASATRVAEYNTRMAAHLAHSQREIQRIATRTQSQVLKQNAKILNAELEQAKAQLIGNAVTADRAFNEQKRARQAAAAEARQGRILEARKAGFVYDAQGNLVPAPADPNAPMDWDARYKRARALKEEAEASLKTGQATAGPGGAPGAVGDPNRGGEPILQKDGAPWVPPTEKEQIQFRAAVPATANVRRIADLLSLAMDKYGGSSKLIGSPEYQEVYALARTLDMEQKDIWGLGVIQGRDLEILEAIRGGKDPNSFLYDVKEQIQKTANTLEQRMLTTMRGGGFTGEWRPARVSAAEATELTPEQNAQRLTRPASSAAKLETPAGQATRAKELEERKAAVPALLRTKPTVETLSEWGQKVDALRASGDITSAEALDLMNQTAPRVLSEWKAKIQKMSPSELVKAQRDPEFFRRVTMLALFESGSARPEEVYRLVLGQ